MRSLEFRKAVSDTDANYIADMYDYIAARKAKRVRRKTIFLALAAAVLIVSVSLPLAFTLSRKTEKPPEQTDPVQSDAKETKIIIYSGGGLEMTLADDRTVKAVNFSSGAAGGTSFLIGMRVGDAVRAVTELLIGQNILSGEGDALDLAITGAGEDEDALAAAVEEAAREALKQNTTNVSFQVRVTTYGTIPNYHDYDSAKQYYYETKNNPDGVLSSFRTENYVRCYSIVRNDAGVNEEDVEPLVYKKKYRYTDEGSRFDFIANGVYFSYILDEETGEILQKETFNAVSREVMIEKALLHFGLTENDVTDCKVFYFLPHAVIIGFTDTNGRKCEGFFDAATGEACT